MVCDRTGSENEHERAPVVTNTPVPHNNIALSFLNLKKKKIRSSFFTGCLADKMRETISWAIKIPKTKNTRKMSVFHLQTPPNKNNTANNNKTNKTANSRLWLFKRLQGDASGCCLYVLQHATLGKIRVQ